jgi:hypothetical protein
MSSKFLSHRKKEEDMITLEGTVKASSNRRGHAVLTSAQQIWNSKHGGGPHERSYPASVFPHDKRSSLQNTARLGGSESQLTKRLIGWSSISAELRLLASSERGIRQAQML